jgi:hypothetical protein
MNRRHAVIATLLQTTALVLAWSATAAEVTADRLINADREPQNWLMTMLFVFGL